MNRSLVYSIITSIFFATSFLVGVTHSMDQSHPVGLSDIHSKSWVDPAPNPTDPTDPRDPRPPSPLPYPEPPLPIPIPVSPNVQELIDIIKGLEIEIQSLRIRILELEARLKTKPLAKNKETDDCNNFIQQLREAIIKLAKIDKAPELYSKNIDRLFLSRLFRSGLLESIPPYHNQIKGSLETKLYCER